MSGLVVHGRLQVMLRCSALTFGGTGSVWLKSTASQQPHFHQDNPKESKVDYKLLRDSELTDRVKIPN